MKKFYVIPLLLPFLVFSQEIKLPKGVNGRIEYSEVVSTDSLASSQLYYNSQMFISTAFRNAKDAGQLKDAKTNTIVTNASIPVFIQDEDGNTMRCKTTFTFSVQSKDGKYRYCINNFYFVCTNESGITTHVSFDDPKGIQMTKTQWMDIQAQTNEFVNYFIEDLKEKMNEYNTSVAANDRSKKRSKRND